MSDEKSDPVKVTGVGKVSSPASKPPNRATGKSSSRQGTPKSTPVSAQKMGHRRVQSSNCDKSLSLVSSPNKSRLEWASVPEMPVDVRACYDDISRYQSECKRQLLAEKRIMHEEWTQAKKQANQAEFKKFQDHEIFITTSRLQYKEYCHLQLKEKKSIETMEKIQEFYALKEAKQLLKEQEKQKETQYLKDELEKAQLRKELELDKKELLRLEQEEKRKAFIEFNEVKKNVENDEKKRESRENEFLLAQEAAGKRKLVLDAFEKQRERIERLNIK